MISKKTRKIFCSVLLAGIIVGQMSSIKVFAEANTQSIVDVRAEVGTPGGVANLGKGSAQITISGNSGQTLVGKKFNVYKLFDAENSAGLESINYTINPTYKTPLQNVVGKKLNKAAAQVTEYEIIDYIQSLNTNKVEGAHADQTLEGRYSDFRYFVNVYKLFDAENSAKLESINYTINPTYKTPLQNVVGKKLNKAAAQVTEYEIIDYIQSLNTNKVEGAHADQTLEGRYSDFRYFVEELRDEIKKLNIKGDVVNVSETKADNSIVIAGLDYGYYVVDEVTAVDDTHSASSLCMVNTANPNAEVQIKSDYPSVIKKIQEDDNKDSIGNSGWNDIGELQD